MQYMELEFGGSSSLSEFERKAQMFNYVDNRAIFEGFNQHLFSPNSARMLWMTQPAWASNNWQILSSDYDTQASFYGVKKACEPLRLQLDLSDHTVTAVNTTGNAAHGLHAKATVYELSGKVLMTREERSSFRPTKRSLFFNLRLARCSRRSKPVLLQMTDSAGDYFAERLLARRTGERLLKAHITVVSENSAFHDEVHRKC